MKQVDTCPRCGSEDITVGAPVEQFRKSNRPELPDLLSVVEVHIVCPDCEFQGTTTVNNASEQHVISAN